MIRSGQAPMQMPQRRQRSALSCGVPFSSSLSVPNGHSSVQRLHWVQRCRKKSGMPMSPARGWTASPRVAASMHCTAFIAAPAPSSAAWPASIGACTVPAA